TLLDVAAGDLLRLVVRPDAHARRQLDLLANRSAEQAIQRLPRGVADQVPHGHLDAAGEVAAERVLRVPGFQVERVAAEDLAAQPIFRRSLERFADPVHRRLAPADEAVVGFQADQQRFLLGAGAVTVLIRGDGWLLGNADQAGVQVGDLHNS